MQTSDKSTITLETSAVIQYYFTSTFHKITPHFTYPLHNHCVKQYSLCCVIIHIINLSQLILDVDTIFLYSCGRMKIST